jgi:hypothetical protein
VFLFFATLLVFGVLKSTIGVIEQVSVANITLKWSSI